MERVRALPDLRWVSAAALAVLLALAAAPQSARGSEPVDDELEEIRRALGQDAATQEERGGVDLFSAPAPTPGGGGGGLTPAVGGGGLTATREMNPAISLIGDFAAAWFSEDENLQRGGHDPNDTGFHLQQLELSFQMAVDPYFRFDSNIVFSLYGVEVEEAYGTTLGLPGNLQVRAGQFLTRFGRLNNSHPHSWDFVDQPLVLGRFFGSEGQRGLGVELSWLAPLPWYVELVGSVTEAGGGATMRSFWNNETLDIEGPGDLVYVAALKQFFPLSDDWSLFWGLSGAFGPNATGRGNRSWIAGTDLYLKWRPTGVASYQSVALQVEWLLRRRQVPNDVLMDHGGYAQLVWRFARRWGTAARWEFMSGVRDDYLDPEQDDHEHRASINVTFWPTEFSRLRLQYAAGVPVWDADVDVVHAVFLTLELVGGAHGAHRF